MSGKGPGDWALEPMASSPTGVGGGLENLDFPIGKTGWSGRVLVVADAAVANSGVLRSPTGC